MSKDQIEQNSQAESHHHFSLFAFSMKSRAFVLLFALLLQILLSGLKIGGTFFDVVLRVIIIMAAINMTADKKQHLVTGIALGVPGLSLVILSHWINSEILDWCMFVLLLALYLFTIRLMLVRIFNAKDVTINTIGMALCTYIMIGTVWILFYTPVLALDPGAFSVPIMDEGDAFHTLTYFSYVTLTTLGYGDIAPVSNIARNLAIIEAITGALFLAVLISRLVGSYVSTRDR